MIYRIAADFTVVLHLAFILFVVFGGLLVLRFWWVSFFHLCAAAWGALIEFKDGICPLTPLENSLRLAAGETGYSGGFIQHYLVPVIYPAGLTPTLRFIIGVFVIGINLIFYGWAAYRVMRRRQHMH